ncbi:MAG: Fe-Mn family superoxide dismutase [Candidatus Dasytiphilus stammeri]
MSYLLPSLPYSYDALEPYIDQETMKIHHTKHHQNYINNTNIILKLLPNEYSKLSIDELIMQLEDIPIDQRMILRNNAGGHANHSMFWKGLKIGTILQGSLKIAIEKQFHHINKFKELFETVAVNHFGSGWVWLIKKGKQLNIVSTANQDNPLMGEKIIGIFGYPIIGLDLWEHAYYLKYQNRRLDYIKAFWNIINWDEAALRYSYQVKKDIL